MSGVDFTPEQFDRLCQVLGLPPDAPEPVVEAEAMLELGLVDALVRDVDRLLANEYEYLSMAVYVGQERGACVAWRG